MSLERIIAELHRQVVELQRRQANVVRHGRVVEVDAARGLVRVDVGHEGAQLVTPFIPWPERAGDRRSWNPPSVGEVMTVISPGGEITERSQALYGGYTDAAPPPSSDGADAVFAVGDVTITVRGGEVLVAAPSVTVTAQEIKLGGEGGKRVARVGDRVHVQSGSSTGMWPIVEGSAVVTAT